MHYLFGNLLACDIITDCSGVSTIHCTTCQQKALMWSLQRLAYDLWALSIKPLVNTWHLVITAKVEVRALSIEPHVSIWHLGYHCKGWGMSAIHWTTKAITFTAKVGAWGLSIEPLRLSLQRFGHEGYPLNYLGYHCKGWGMYTKHKTTWQPVL